MWMSYVTHMNKLFHTYWWVVSDIWIILSYTQHFPERAGATSVVTVAVRGIVIGAVLDARNKVSPAKHQFHFLGGCSPAYSSLQCVAVWCMRQRARGTGQKGFKFAHSPTGSPLRSSMGTTDAHYGGGKWSWLEHVDRYDTCKGCDDSFIWVSTRHYQPYEHQYPACLS